MKVLFKTYNCGAGDCCFLTLQKEDGAFHIMVDCGSLKDDILSYVVDELGKRIDLLIVTHIDNDHIVGISELLVKLPDLIIGKIIFNCYHRPKGEQTLKLNDKQKGVLEELKRRLPFVAPSLETKANAREAISLSEKILKNEKWARVWGTDEIVAGKGIDLDGGFGRILVLSPLQDDLNALETQFRKEFWSKFFDKYPTQYTEEEEIYEVLLRLWETTFLISDNTSKVSYAKPTIDTFKKAADAKVVPVSLPNKCSIAFVYEYEGHRFLLMGDADPIIVSKSLKAQINSEPPFMMDFIKVSHHGSSHSTTKELIATSDSKHYYFTGGDKEERPSLETLSRVITAPLKGQGTRVLHFNRKNNVLKDLCSLPEFADFPCEIDLENKPYEVEI